MTTTPSAAGGGGHTPGPWCVQDDHGKRWIETGIDNDDTICEVHRRNYSAREKDVEFNANAYLIAAAPSLLEALQELVQKFDIERQWHSAKGGDDYPDSTEITRARDAIAKATGTTGASQ